MSLEDIRRRYQPQPADQSELVKQLRAKIAQQEKDIIELLGEVERLNTGKPPGPPIIPGAENAEIDAELEAAKLPSGMQFVPGNGATQPREAENLAANESRFNARTVRGEPIVVNAFSEPYVGRR